MIPACPGAAGAVLATAIDGGAPWLEHLGATGLLALAPFVIIAGTSFAKVALVLAIVRAALGSPGVPPASVVTALAAVLSIFVMAPVFGEMAAAVELAAPALAGPTADPLGLAEARGLYDAAAPPLLDFLALNTPRADVELFLGLAGEPAAAEPGLRVMLPAFAVAEIEEAFLIGFLVFVPLLVIDLLVTNTLLALGMHMLPPLAISLPLKLLVFVAVDGWELLVSGLVATYGY